MFNSATILSVLSLNSILDNLIGHLIMSILTTHIITRVNYNTRTILNALQKPSIHFKSRFNIILLYDARSESRASGVIFLTVAYKNKRGSNEPLFNDLFLN